MTLLEVLQKSTEFLSKRKIDKPRLNAEHLLGHVLARTRMDLYLEFERKLTASELAPLRELLRRRGEGEPLQHLLGTVEFCGQTFLCDKRAMVPRPETEQFTESLIAETGNRIAKRILDVGTGSGVIALSLAKKFPDAEIWATDIADEALALARQNAQRLGLGGRVQFLKSDLLANVTGAFDVIVANLPYVPKQDRHLLSREVLHDPEIALFGGERGDEVMRRLIDQAPKHLKAGALFALEVGINHAVLLSKVLAEKKYHDIAAKNDYSGVTRFLFARYG